MKENDFKKLTRKFNDLQARQYFSCPGDSKANLVLLQDIRIFRKNAIEKRTDPSSLKTVALCPKLPYKDHLSQQPKSRRTPSSVETDLPPKQKA